MWFPSAFAILSGCVCFHFPVGKFLSWVRMTSACPAMRRETVGLLLLNTWNRGMAYFGEPRVEPLSGIPKSSSPRHSHYASTVLQDRRSGAVFPVGSLSFPRHPRATTACGLQFWRIYSLTFDCILINSRTSSSLPYNMAMPSCLMCLPPSVVGYWENEPEHRLYCQTNTD